MSILDLKYSEILSRNKEMSSTLPDEKYRIAVISNIMVSQLNDILEYTLRDSAIPALVISGDYDNIVQDSQKFTDTDAVVIFWELCNIVEGLQYRIETTSTAQYQSIADKAKVEISLALKNLNKTPLVIMNKFSASVFDHGQLKNGILRQLSDELNLYLENAIPRNVKLIDLEPVFQIGGILQSVDFRYFYSSKSLYSIHFYKAYVTRIMPLFLSATGKAKKALIFDCDNTLWHGILGEDGPDNIQMSPTSSKGAIFAEIQAIALAMNRKGVIIGLCSKNNYADVDGVLKSHPDMKLRNENIAIIMCNWDDKVTNLVKIASTLNIGLDSIVFIDDSDFEVNLVREQLPEVTVLQVPKKVHEYPAMLRESSSLFYGLSDTAEDSSKMKMYKDQAKRAQAKENFSDLESYLTSLSLKATLYNNDQNHIPRISQMTQKTNQFNLTTRRYTETEIQDFIRGDETDVIALAVSDKYGDSGITGLCIINYTADGKQATIDTLLMSCRIIGRNIEFTFMDYLIGRIAGRNVKTVSSQYLKSQKNSQVASYYDKCSFALDVSSEDHREYVLEVDDYNFHNIEYIKVNNGSED